MFCPLVGGGPKHRLHILGGVLPVIGTVEIMQVVLHAYKIYGKEAPITYELWYKLIRYVLTMTSLNLEGSPGI